MPPGQNDAPEILAPTIPVSAGYSHLRLNVCRPCWQSKTVDAGPPPLCETTITTPFIHAAHGTMGYPLRKLCFGCLDYALSRLFQNPAAQTDFPRDGTTLKFQHLSMSDYKVTHPLTPFLVDKLVNLLGYLKVSISIHLPLKMSSTKQFCGFYMPAHVISRSTAVYKLPDDIVSLYPADPSDPRSVTSYDVFDSAIKDISDADGIPFEIPDLAVVVRPSSAPEASSHLNLAATFELLSGPSPWPGRCAHLAPNTVMAEFTIDSLEDNNSTTSNTESSPSSRPRIGTAGHPTVVAEAGQAEVFILNGTPMFWQSDLGISRMTLYKCVTPSPGSGEREMPVPIGWFRASTEVPSLEMALTIPAGTIVLEIPEPCGEIHILVALLSAFKSLYRVRQKINRIIYMARHNVRPPVMRRNPGSSGSISSLSRRQSSTLDPIVEEHPTPPSSPPARYSDVDVVRQERQGRARAIWKLVRQSTRRRTEDEARPK